MPQFQIITELQISFNIILDMIYTNGEIRYLYNNIMQSHSYKLSEKDISLIKSTFRKLCENYYDDPSDMTIRHLSTLFGITQVAIKTPQQSNAAGILPMLEILKVKSKGKAGNFVNGINDLIAFLNSITTNGNSQKEDTMQNIVSGVKMGSECPQLYTLSCTMLLRIIDVNYYSSKIDSEQQLEIVENIGKNCTVNPSLSIDFLLAICKQKSSNILKNLVKSGIIKYLMNTYLLQLLQQAAKLQSTGKLNLYRLLKFLILFGVATKSSFVKDRQKGLVSVIFNYEQYISVVKNILGSNFDIQYSLTVCDDTKNEADWIDKLYLWSHDQNFAKLITEDRSECVNKLIVILKKQINEETQVKIYAILANLANDFEFEVDKIPFVPKYNKSTKSSLKLMNSLLQHEQTADKLKNLLKNGDILHKLEDHVQKSLDPQVPKIFAQVLYNIDHTNDKIKYHDKTKIDIFSEANAQLLLDRAKKIPRRKQDLKNFGEILSKKPVKGEFEKDVLEKAKQLSMESIYRCILMKQRGKLLNPQQLNKILNSVETNEDNASNLNKVMQILEIYMLKNPDWIKSIDKQRVLQILDVLERYSIKLNNKKLASSFPKIVIDWAAIQQALKTLFDANQWVKYIDTSFERKRMFWLLCASNSSEETQKKLRQYLQKISESKQKYTESQMILAFLAKSNQQLKNHMCLQMQSGLNEIFGSQEIGLNKFLMAAFMAENWSENKNQTVKEYLSKKFIPTIFSLISKNGQNSDHICQFLTAALPLTPSFEEFSQIYEKISPQQWLSKYGKFSIVLYEHGTTFMTKARAQQYLKNLSNNINKDFPDGHVLMQILNFLRNQHKVLSKDSSRSHFQSLLLKNVFRNYYAKGSKQQINWYWMLYPYYVQIMKHIIEILSQRVNQTSSQQQAKQNAQLFLQILETNNNNEQLTEKQLFPIIQDYRIKFEKIGQKQDHSTTINTLDIENLQNAVNKIKAGDSLDGQKSKLINILDVLSKKQIQVKQKKHQQDRKKQQIKKKERKMSMDKMKIERQEKIKSEKSLPDIVQEPEKNKVEEIIQKVEQTVPTTVPTDKVQKVTQQVKQIRQKIEKIPQKKSPEKSIPAKEVEKKGTVQAKTQKKQQKVTQKHQNITKATKTNETQNKSVQQQNQIKSVKTGSSGNEQENSMSKIQEYFKNQRGNPNQLMTQNTNFQYYQLIKKQTPLYNTKLQIQDKNFEADRQQFDYVEEDFEHLIKKIQQQQNQRTLTEKQLTFFEALKLLKKIVDGEQIPQKMNMIIPIFEKQAVPIKFKDTLGYLLAKSYSVWQDSRILYILLKKQKTLLSRQSCYNLLNDHSETFVLSHRWKLFGYQWLDLAMSKLKEKNFHYVAEACVVAEYNLPNLEDIQYFQKKKHLQIVSELFIREKGINTQQEKMYAFLLVGTSSRINQIRLFYLKKKLHLSILFLMSEHTEHIGVLSNGSYALSSLIYMQSAQSLKLSTMNEQLEKVFLGYQVMSKTTQFTNKQRSLLQSSCSFISNMTYNNDQVKNNLRQHRMVYLLMHMLSQLVRYMPNPLLSLQTGQNEQISQNDMNTLKHVLRALGNCSVSELCAKDLMDQDFPSHSIVLSEKIGFLGATLDLSRLKILKLMMDIYANLTVHKYEIKLFHRSGVTDFVINMLEKTTLNAEILMGAIDTIDGLCQQPSIQKFAIQDKNLSFILIDILKMQEDQRVVTKSTRLLTNLTINKTIIPKILEANLLSVLGNIVLLSHHNRKLETYINKIINRVFNAQPDIDIILKSGYLDCLVRCIETSEIIQDSHVDILLSYAKNLPSFLNRRAFMSLIKVLIDKPSNKQIVEKCIQIFKILLSKSPDNEQEDLIIDGAPKMYQSLLMTHPLDMLYLLGSHCIRSEKARHLMRKTHSNKVIDIINSDNFMNVTFNDPRNYSIAVSIFGSGEGGQKQNVKSRIKQAIQIVSFLIFNNPEPVQKNFTTAEEQQAIKTLKSKMNCKLFRVDGSYKKARVDIDDEYAIRAYKYPDGEVKKKYYLPVRNIRDWRFHFQKDRSKEQSTLLQRENKELWKYTYFVKNEKGFFSQDVKMQNCITLMGGIKWGQFVSINLQFQNVETKILFVKSVTVLMSMFNS